MQFYLLASGTSSNFDSVAAVTCKTWQYENQIFNRTIFVNALRVTHTGINKYLLRKYAKEDSGLALLTILIGVKYFLEEQGSETVQTQFFLDYQLKNCGGDEGCWNSNRMFLQVMKLGACMYGVDHSQAEIASCPKE